MNLASVLKSIDTSLDGTTAKLAAENAAEKPATKSPATEKAASLVDAALASVTKTEPKTASALPIPALHKLATEMAGKDAVETAKIAHTIGEAMADGYVARIALYEKAAEAQQKIAMEQIDPEMLKLAQFAKDDPNGFLDWVTKQAGVDARAVKQAEDEGAQELIDAAYSAGCNHYKAGYEVGYLMGTPA